MASELRASYSRALLKLAAAAVRSLELSFWRPSLTKNSACADSLGDGAGRFGRVGWRTDP